VAVDHTKSFKPLSKGILWHPTAKQLMCVLGSGGKQSADVIVYFMGEIACLLAGESDRYQNRVWMANPGQTVAQIGTDHLSNLIFAVGCVSTTKS
jgi:hypothetical protein